MDRIKENRRDKVRGAILGGAAGDALGYPVEFLSAQAIKAKYGSHGITKYALDPATHKALISDDTQMTLFTANGIMFGDTRLQHRGVGGVPHSYVVYTYRDWYYTQTHNYRDYVSAHDRDDETAHISWLLDVPELYNRRSPGNTCLSALESILHSKINDDYLEHPRNNSKGCGGIMRVAPLGLYYNANPRYGLSVPIEVLDKEGAILAAITHGHSLGYMPAAVLTHILIKILDPDCSSWSLKDIIVDAKRTVAGIFPDDPELPLLCSVIDKAIALAENHSSDEVNIPQLGEGWVAEETLAISLYCALRYTNDFSGGITAAVNHSGDSDSTGAVTGNILGAINGFSTIDDKWKTDLELYNVIMEIADDLTTGCHTDSLDKYYISEHPWDQKYVESHRAVCKPILFWHEYEENGYLSNWYESPFVIDDFRYLHVEQYIMAQKAKLFHDAEKYTAILRATTPQECKALGRDVKPFSFQTWSEVRYDILKAGVYAKFAQNPDLNERLFYTGNSILSEASPKDDTYGLGISAAKAATMSPDEWPGENLLGKALMEVRAELQDQDR